jgi:predicted acyl esterase
VREARDTRIPVRGGIRLAADVFLPDADGPHPALVALSPYGKEIQSLPLPTQPPTSPAYWREIEAGDPRYLTAAGYAHVIADVRGTSRSEGSYRGWMSSDEAEDAYDVIEWTAAQEWCDGNVGMVGVSYFGAIQLAAAALQPPHLKAIMPLNAPADYYREGSYHGGILHTFFDYIYMVYARGRQVSDTVSGSTPEELREIVDRLTADPDLAVYAGLYNIAANPERSPLFFDLLANPCDGPFYWERSAYRQYEKIQVPFYTGSGWWAYGHMHLRGAFQHFAGIDAPRKLFIESRVEADAPMDDAYNAEVVRWYDHWLKGAENGIMDEPPIKLHVRGAGWRQEHEWPLARTRWVELHLRDGGALSTDPDPGGSGPDVFVQAPLLEDHRVATCDYLSDPMPADVEVIGPMALTLHASIDSTDTNWMASVIDVAPDGTQVELTRGFLKASHHAVDEARSRPWQPYHPHLESVPVEPGRVHEYRIEISPLANVFAEGHRIKLSISSLDHSRWPPRDPELGADHQPWHVCRSVTVAHSIHRGPKHPSALLTPLVSGELP